MTVALAAAIGLATASMASAVDTYVAGEAAGGVASSRHNLGAFGAHIATNATTEVCIFCHTPHHTNTGGTNGLAPLWNRGTSAPTSFTAYGTTLGGTLVENTDIGSASLACLSCHDGVTTFDNLVNAPGKGGVVAGGSTRGYEFFEDGASAGTSITMSAMPMMLGRANIGLDLSNDHPMSVIYNGGTVASLRTTDTVISSIDLTSDLADSATTYDNGNLTKNLWAVKGFVSADATIGDLLRGPGFNRVECSSCHDPHFNNKSYQEVDATYAPGALGEDESNGLFLRRVGGNTGSGVCRTCHNK